MKKEEVKKRIEKLKKVIRRHRYLYHVEDKQEISPEALDSLKHELYKLEQDYPDLITPDSPTQRIGGKPLEKFEKVEHSIPMLSIEDVFSEEEIYDWKKYLKRLIPSENFDYFCELKIDGFAVTLIYENGELVKGATRGNGKIGENVTDNLKTIESIPLKISLHDNFDSELEKLESGIKKVLEKGKIEIRGEVYMNKSDFEEVNRKREKNGEKTYANPRNLAAGSIRQLNPKLAASRPLRFLAYDLITDLGQEKHSQEHRILPKLGFKTDEGKKCGSLEEVIDFWREAAKRRDALPFQVDGVVVNIDDNSLFEKLGVSGKSPRGVRAIKFSPQQATTKVKEIDVQVGRTGKITPVAFLDPVKVGGTKITRATLHNFDQIKRLGVKKGDTVIIERAGDVIPAVVKVLKDLRTGSEKKFEIPKRCPVCETRLVKPKEEVDWRCPNPNCQSRKRELISYFASRKGFDIDGLGPKIIDKLIDEKLISQPADIFTLSKGDLLPLERFADKSAENLVNAIEKSKKISLSNFINSLGIRHVGEETAIDLAQYFGSLEKIKKASKEELEKIPDIGSQVAKSIYDWFDSNQNKKLISKLLDSGVKILPPKKVGEKLKGKKFVLTGGLENLTRSEAERKIRLLGGNPTSSVSKKTDYVVAGENPGSKINEAKKIGVKILNEKQFLEMISE
jgi:DNA ligase (NAD+)